MKQIVHSTGVLVSCACLLVAIVALGAAPTALAADANVTFKNQTASTQHVLAVYGDEGSCSDMSGKDQITLEPGQSATVESGDSKVCWCTSTLGKVGSCNPWHMTKAGKVQKIR